MLACRSTSWVLRFLGEMPKYHDLQNHKLPSPDKKQDGEIIERMDNLNLCAE